MQVELNKRTHIINQSLLLEIEQDDKYVVIKLSNSDKEYKIVLSDSNSKLSENQKTSSSEIVNKFYSEI